MSDVMTSALLYLSGIFIFLFSFRMLTLNPRNQSYRLLFYLMLTIDVTLLAEAIKIYRPEFVACLADEAIMAARILRRPLLLHLTLLFLGDARIKKAWSMPLIYIPACLALLPVFPHGTAVELWLHGGEFVSGADFLPIILIEILLLLYIAAVAVVFFKKIRQIPEAKIGADSFAFVLIMISALSGPAVTVARLLASNESFIRLSDHFSIVPAAALIWVFYDTHVKESLSSESTVSRPNLITRGYANMVYSFISYFFIIGAAFEFAYNFYFLNSTFSDFSILFIYSLATGCVIGLIEEIKISEKIKDLIPSLLMSGFIPIMMFFCRSKNVFLVLFLAVLLLMLFVLLSNRIAIISMGLTTLIFGALYTLKFNDSGSMAIQAIDYMAALSIFVAISVISFIINKLFIARMNENESQVQLQDLVTNIALSFTNVYAADLNNNINKLLNVAGTFSAVERAVVWLVDGSGMSARMTHEWYRDGEIPAKPVFPPVFIPDFMDFYNALVRNEILELSSDFFESYFKNKEINPYTYLQANSVLCIPLTADSASQKLLTELADGKPDTIKDRYSFMGLNVSSEQGTSLAGFIALTSAQKKMKWSNNHKYLLRMFASTIMHICSRAQSERMVFSMAYFDQLTGLPNRFFLAEDLEKKLKTADKTGGLVGVALIDLDFFKYVNDAIGHNTGDEVLRTVAERFSKSVSEQDVVVRFGGDEFIVIFDGVYDKEEIIMRTEKIMKILEEPVTAGGHGFFITASTGVAIYPYDGADADTLIKNADMTMYTSKEEGKNRFCICTDEIKNKIISEVFLINHLNFALEKNQLFLNYQPIVRIADGSVSGFEVLCRWDLPGTGLVPPDKFIRLAEKSSLINQIGDYILFTACKQAREWQDMGLIKLPMSVNFSMRQFQDANLITTVADILNRTGFAPEHLVMEITESIDSRNENQVAGMLKEFKNLGAAIAVDDFGMQYSSLNRLKNMPFSKLKIDMQFIKGISVNEKDRGVTRTIIQLAKNFGLTVVAEGVETKEQFDLLREWGCDEIQGYYFYKPLSVKEIEDVLKEETQKKR